ncbi:hypothetical protein TrLO_g13873 [Triparma laevis f. longispina]|uniref:Uncharacterized protein n=1 Tax=Triparma laevis f. longispina TaxID=1714387 RepID=A0A9W7FTC1_9STRA|nr:hypothetical protein TrLO_g13873 [Triparma laevis f. longispina]
MSTPKPATPQTGITWPLDAKGRASSTPVNKSVWTTALTAFKSSNNAKQLISKIDNEKNWRANYMKYVNEFVVLQAGASPEECLDSCRLGLQKLNSTMTWSVNGEVKSSALDAMSSSSSTPFVTEIKANSGSSPFSSFTLKSPLGSEAETLSGKLLKAQGEAWATYGCIEPSASAALTHISATISVNKLVENKVFVLLGATSSLGPFKSLAKLGATIACVARKGKKMEKLIKDAEASSATLLLPTREGVPGADLLVDAPALADWILSLPKGSEQIVLGCYAYLDGEKHVRASVAMDLIAEKVCAQRKGSALAYLVSPATSHAAPEDAVLDVTQRYMNTPTWHGLFRAGFGTFAKNTFYNADNDIKIFNGLSNFQGPNYALAKTSQQWRAMLAKAEGAVVSANHAPAARTESMVGYATIAAALEGMQSFPPLVAFDPDTASDMMAAILLWDLTSSTSAALPSNKDAHPTLLLIQNACHGGMWRCAYDMESVNTPSFLFGRFTSSYTPTDSLAK